MEKLSFLLRAPVLTLSGYGVHARQVARYVFENADKHNLDITTELLDWGTTPWITDIYAYDGLIGEIIQSTNNKKQFYDISVQLQLPHEWDHKKAKYNVGITAGIETDRCKPEWIDCINKMDLVVVPSEFTKKCFTHTAKIHNKTLLTDIIVIPESFLDEILYENKKELELNLETKFNLLVFGQITGNNPENDRKNIFYTFKWLAERFAGMPDVGIVFKTNVGRHTKLDKAMVRNLFQKLTMEVNTNPVGPKFYLLHGMMSDEEVASLYTNKNINGLVSLSRGEGFGIPLLEAAASGLPVIATDWSAHTEFLNLIDFVKIPCDIVEIHESRVDQLFPKEAKWALPKEKEAKELLLNFYKNHETYKTIAKQQSYKIKENYSYSAIVKHYDNLIERVIKQC